MRQNRTNPTIRRPLRVFTLWAASALVALGATGANSADLDERAQYPSWLSDSYVDVDLGAIRYPFSTEQLQPGFTAASVETPALAVRVILGHRLSPNFAVQLSYMRPFEWVKYRKVNGADDHTVWMNVAGLGARGTLPVSDRLSLDGELGLGIVTRSGFRVGDAFGVPDASYATVLLGSAVRYRLGDSWDVGVRAAYLPGRSSVAQPHTLLVTGGASYSLQPLSAQRVREAETGGALFPRDLLQVGYATDALGLGVNHFVSRTVPIFWDGLVDVHQGLTVRYQRNAFHTRRLFSLDLGVSLGRWESARDRQSFVTASAFPLLRLTPIRLDAADFYFAYSVAGPTYISQVLIDGEDTGKHFTFQDSMGIGCNFGAKRNWNAEARITHYSNGNLFSRNAAVTIPLSFNVGYSF